MRALAGSALSPGVESRDSDERSAEASATSGKQEWGGWGGAHPNQGFAGALLPGGAYEFSFLSAFQ